MTLNRHIVGIALILLASGVLLLTGCKTSDELTASEPDDAAQEDHKGDTVSELHEGFEGFKSEMRSIEEEFPKLRLSSRSEKNLRALVTELVDKGRGEEANEVMKYLVMKVSLKALSSRQK